MSENDGQELLATVGLGCVVGALLALLVVLAVIVRGFVLSTLWAWFVVPIFGLPVLTVPWAIGLAMVVATAAPHPRPEASKERKGWSTLLGDAAAYVLAPLLALPLGWLVLQFV